MNRTLVAFVASLLPAAAFALGGTLDRPGLATPAGVDLRPAIEVLSDDAFDYTTGWFINSHSMLCYAGDAADLNRFLDALSRVDGVTLSLRFSKETGPESSPFPGGPAPKPCQWSVDHNAWGDAGLLSVTVYLGDGKIDFEQLALPSWHGATGSPADSVRPEQLPPEGD